MTAYHSCVTCRSSSLGHPSVSRLLCHSAGRFCSAAVGRRRPTPRRIGSATGRRPPRPTHRTGRRPARPHSPVAKLCRRRFAPLPPRSLAPRRSVRSATRTAQPRRLASRRPRGRTRPLAAARLYPLAFLLVRLPGPRRPPSGRVARPSAAPSGRRGSDPGDPRRRGRHPRGGQRLAAQDGCRGHAGQARGRTGRRRRRRRAGRDADGGGGLDG